MPYWSQMRWISGQYVEGGMITPPAPWIGSPMKAATLSAPSSVILASSWRAQARPKSSRDNPSPFSNQYG